MKILNKIKENKIFFVVFGLFMISSVIYLSDVNLNALIDPFYPPLYVVNYNCGLSSRLFIGAVFSLFIDKKLDIIVLTKILLCFYFFICFLISLFTNSRLKNTEYEKGIGIYITFAAISPVFLSFLQYLGTTDMFWVLLVIASLFAVDKKYLRWLIPAFCVASLAIHEVFAATYLPLITITVLYQYIKNPNMNNLFFISVSALIVGAAAVYFIFIGDNTMKLTSDEFVSYAANRLDMHGLTLSDYYIRSVFFWETPEAEAYSGFIGFLKYNFENFILGVDGSFYKIFVQIISTLFTAIPFFILTVNAYRQEKIRGKKFIFFCTALIALPTVILVLFSTDTERYAMHFILNVIFALLFFVKERDTSFNAAYNRFVDKINSHKISAAVIGVMLALSVLS